MKKLLSVGIFVMAVGLCAAAPQPAGIFGHNMVLQRDRAVPVWGWVEPGQAVRVAFGGQEVVAVTDESGKWMVTLKAMPASAEPREMTISGGGTNNPTVLTNVVVGEVWLCSGQSNMEWPLARATNGKAETAAADFPMIRHIKVGAGASPTPMRDVKAVWQVCSRQTAARFTAVGYFFGRRLHKELDVPIGLIGSNWGGTRIEPWTPPVGFRAVPELKAISDKVDATDPTSAAGSAVYRKVIADIKDWVPKAEGALDVGAVPPPMPRLPVVGRGQQAPTMIYNGRIHPLIPYALRGAIWYQGESNGSEGEIYLHKMKALISGWRSLWGYEFPFYYVQLANFGAPNKKPQGGDGYAGVRDAQRRALSIPKTGMAVIIDIGLARNIHPPNKQDVGTRLALWALAKEYGREKLIYSGPLYKSHRIEGDAIHVAFSHVGSGLMIGSKTGLKPVVEQEVGFPGDGDEASLKQFAIAGRDKTWHWAEAEIDGDTVVVRCAAVPDPVAVRYAYRHNPAGCNLYNLEGLPAAPFRTDDW